MCHLDSNDKPLLASEAAEKGLRQRAEDLTQEIASPSLFEIATSSPEEFAKVLYELQVHQIELELQNEELRQTQLNLEESRRRYFELYDLAPVGYLTLNLAGIIEEANLTAAEMLGVTRAELVKRPFSHFICPPDQDTFYLQNKQLLEKGEAPLIDLRLKSANGPPIWANLKRTLVANQQSTRLIINDITERKMAEEALQASYKRLEATLADLKSAQDQLIRQEKLAAVGQLAAGIAHDFNNILAIIMLEAELCQRQINKSSDYRLAKLQTIIEQTNIAAALIQQILDFSRQSVIQPKAVELTSFLKEHVDLLQHTLQENIHTTLNLKNHSCTIFADKNQLRQLIINLAMNARDAMPKGGQLTFTIEKRHPGTPLPFPEMPAEDWVQISVTDTGEGISSEDLPRIFEPYFTTKAPGKGTGLGLAQVQGIVKQSNGFITVESAVGKGTTFTIYFPAMTTKPKAESLPLSAEGWQLPVGHGELVLVVEDNLLLREALTSTLEALNYKIITAVNGIEALEILKMKQDEVAVIVSDLTMPRMGGEALFSALRQQGVTIPIIFMSGNPAEVEFAQELIKTGMSGFLKKPLDFKEMASILARATQKHGKHQA